MLTEADAGANAAPSSVDAEATRARFGWVPYLVAGIALVAGALGLARVVEPPAPEQVVITIPAGTGDRMAAGEDVNLLPPDLSFKLRDHLIVVNEDDQVHQVGPFTVAPGDRLDKEFSEAATIEGFCSLHPSGRITITIGDS